MIRSGFLGFAPLSARFDGVEIPQRCVRQSAYDVFDRRIGKEIDEDGNGVVDEVERFVYDGENIALVFDGDGNQTHRYLQGVEVDQILASEDANGEVNWALTDNQGTVRDVINSQGIVINHIILLSSQVL